MGTGARETGATITGMACLGGAAGFGFAQPAAVKSPRTITDGKLHPDQVP